MTGPVEMCTGDAQLVNSGLRGYRTWILNPGGRLTSTAVAYDWQLKSQVAECLASPWNPALGDLCGLEPGHAVPDARCKCGFYAWYHPRDTRIVEADVFGAVEASGRVLLGAHGFRAERARLLGVVIPEDFAEHMLSARDLAERLGANGIPVFPSREKLLDRLPPDDVSALVDHSCGEQCRATANTVVRVPPGVHITGHGGQFFSMTPAVFTRSSSAAAVAAMAQQIDQMRQAVLSQRLDPPPPPRWKRRAAIAGAATGIVVAASVAVSLVVEIAVGNGGWDDGVLLALNAASTLWWTRLLRHARRWGR